MMKILMLRNVLIGGEHCSVGETVEVEDAVGRMLIRMKRAESAEQVEPAEEEEKESKDGEQESQTANVETAAVVPAEETAIGKKGPVSKQRTKGVK